VAPAAQVELVAKSALPAPALWVSAQFKPMVATLPLVALAETAAVL